MASNEKARINKLNEDARFFGGEDAPQLDIYDVRALINFYDRKCLDPDCPTPEEPATSPDHVIPLSLGGENKLENLQLLHVNCNKRKGDKVMDFRQGKVCTPEYKAQFVPENEDRRLKHDWQEIEGEFVISDISTRDLAHRFAVPYPTLRDYAISHEWEKQRQEYRSKVVADTMQAAQVAEVSSRVMILQAAREALLEWRKNRGKQNTADLAKILELAAKVEGLELDKRTLTIKDWRDAATQNGEHADDIQQFATNAATDYYNGDSGGDREPGAGWTD